GGRRRRAAAPGAAATSAAAERPDARSPNGAVSAGNRGGPLERRPAAVAGEHGAGQARRLVGGQEHDQRRDLLGRLQAGGMVAGGGVAEDVVAADERGHRRGGPGPAKGVGAGAA